MNKQELAVLKALASIAHVEEHDPVAPLLTLDEELVCRGKVK